MPTEEQNPTSTLHCPLENLGVDVERCARCFWRSSGHASCSGDDRMAANDWRFLLRALGI